MKKKWLGLILSGCMLAGLAGCGNAPQQPADTANTEAVVTEASQDPSDEANTEAVVTAVPQEQAVTETPDEQVDTDPTLDTPAPDSALGMIQTMCDSADLWYVPQTDDSILIRYMVTDLDENGRLELVRAEYNTETMFEKNRFYEITEDFTGIEKMHYQLEDYFYDGEENGFAPDLLLWDTQVTCYRCAQFGIALDDYTGPSYFYIVSDKSEYEDYYGNLASRELYMNLHVDNSGGVSVWTYGDIITRSDGSVEYCDQEGLDCDEDGFWLDIAYGHDPEYGWDEDLVHWEFVEIADVQDAPDLLLSSLNGFTRERIVTAIESEEE